MNVCPSFDHLLVFPHLHVQNANAVSSPLTHGFPSMTAFLGLMWAFERKARAAGLDVAFKAVGTVCHDHQEQVTKGGFANAFCLTRNPIMLRDQRKLINSDGKTATPAILEEGRIHLELSLVFAVCSERWIRDPDARRKDVAALAELLGSMRVAGGTLLPPAQPWRHLYKPHVIDLTGTEDDRHTEFRKARMRLLPGFALVSRDDRLEERLAELQDEKPTATRLDAWLSLSRINWRYQSGEKDGKGEWLNDRKGQGWIVPIPVGYGALGEVHAPGSVANARDSTTAFRFVESLYSIGEWISPHRLQSPQQLLWYADSQPDDGLYRCRNDYCPTTDPFERIYDFD